MTDAAIMPTHPVFLMVELSDKEDCKDIGTARDRLRTAIDQLEALDSDLGNAQWN